MKNILLTINIILLVLVGYLYYLHFHTDGAKAVTHSSSVNTSADNKSKVAYIDLDSLQDNYGYYQKLKIDFEHKQESANDQLAALQTKYQNRAMQLQQKAATMTQKEQAAAMEEINKMQQELQERKQKVDNDLYNENSKMKQDILTRIEDFLKTYNKDGKYSYIFSYEPGFMFYKDSTLNITPDVISGLNKLDSEKTK